MIRCPLFLNHRIAFSSFLSGKPSYLFDVCTVCCSSRDENNWDLVDKIINPDLSGVSATTEALFKADLDRYLSYEDEESGNYCLHLVLKSNKPKLVQMVHKACTSIAEIKNNENKSPKDLAKLYNNIKHYSIWPNISPSSSRRRNQAQNETRCVYILYEDCRYFL